MLKELSLAKVVVKDHFWRNYLDVIKKVTIPYQYKVMNDELAIVIEKERDDDVIPNEKSHALENLRIAAGISSGQHYGWLFQDSDVYKWLEAVAYSLVSQADSDLERLADEVINIICQAQDDDGYLSTFYQIERPDLKFKKLFESHELYCAGHLIEAAIAYDEATGKDDLLKVALKWCQCIKAHFGSAEGQIDGADGHQEIELALVRLFEYLGEEEYLELAGYFLEIRGKDPLFYQKQIKQNIKEGLMEHEPKVDLTYLQAYTQPKNQTTAEGHAVRMLYMCAAMARLAKNQENSELLQSCETIWSNIYRKKLYITGGLGSTFHGEAFTGDYDLPNDTMYCETCASIALVYFAYELFKLNPKPEYMEVIEKTLYNGIVSGASLDGSHFFYVNPLEVTPDISKNNPGKSHVKNSRPDWLGCACCPPNFARTIGSVSRYFYLIDEEKKQVYLNLIVQSEASLTLENKEIKIKQTTNFPKENSLKIDISSENQAFELKIRKPNWLTKVNLSGADYEETESYLIINHQGASLSLSLTFETPIFSIKANPLVIENTGRLAIQRGPFIYCSESVDNGTNLQRFRLTNERVQSAEIVWKQDGLTEPPLLKIKALEEYYETNWTHLYRLDGKSSLLEQSLTLIPYYTWANRGESELLVWHYQA